MVKKLKNVRDLRNQLLENIESMMADNLVLRKAKEVANSAGKVLSSAKLQMESNKMIGQAQRRIAFLDIEEEKG